MEMKCPVCGTELIEVDAYSTEYSEEAYYDYMSGTCPNCKKDFFWEEKYEFAGRTFPRDNIGDIFSYNRFFS